MAQVKVFVLRATIEAHRSELSEAIHESVMEAFRCPRAKRFQRFIALEPNDFVHPDDRSDRTPTHAPSDRDRVRLARRDRRRTGRSGRAPPTGARGEA